MEEEIESDNSINLAFMALRNNKPLILKMEVNGQMTIRTDDMDLAGNLIQSLAAYLNIPDLQVNCDFPDEFEILEQTLIKVFDSKSLIKKFLFNINIILKLDRRL